jgi:hypothetical protein
MVAGVVHRRACPLVLFGGENRAIDARVFEHAFEMADCNADLRGAVFSEKQQRAATLIFSPRMIWNPSARAWNRKTL